jgi:hypothetical protein
MFNELKFDANLKFRHGILVPNKLDEQDKLIADYLQGRGIIFSCFFQGATKKDNRECDSWKVFFQSKLHNFEEQFYTGIGHRKLIRPMPSDYKKLSPRCLAVQDFKKDYLKPVAPTAASVLYCLLSDSQASGESFPDWCGGLGYDTDSRKAFDIYMQCCNIGHKMRITFSSQELETLDKLLQDY